MDSQTVSSATIKLNLPSGILGHAQEESRRIGISLQDFIRMLMATYFANSGSIRAVSRDEALFDRAQHEIKSGKFSKITTKGELTSYLRSLDN